MHLRRPDPPRSLISLVSMIDVLMIMLVFFMVTSTYLNLNMVPMAEKGDAPAETPAQAPASSAKGPATLLIRLGADGLAYVQGQAQTPASLTALLRARLDQDPATPVVVLPSGHANTQALVALMDTATRAGVSRLQIIRLEARQ